MSARFNVHANEYKAITANIVEFFDDERKPDFNLLRVHFEQPVGWHEMDRPMPHTVPVVSISILDPEAFFAALDAAREAFAHRHETFENGGPAPIDPCDEIGVRGTRCVNPRGHTDDCAFAPDEG